MENVYHTGERLAQESANEVTMAERNGRVVTNKIIPGARNFIEKLPFVIVSTQDKEGRITVSALTGTDGFIRVAGESEIEVDGDLCTSNPHDIFWQNIHEHDKTGWLFIEPATRRRFRLNGSITIQGKKILVSVDQAYPNCPKYIQQRSIAVTGKPVYTHDFEEGTQLTEAIAGMITRADTLFVGSSDGKGNMDASHRGGLPGFIHVADAGTLVIPDYAGNSMYNTLGNFVVNPNACILVIDFAQEKTLQLQGAASVQWQPVNEEVKTGGTGRYWTFKVASWRLSENLKGVHTRFMAYSPFNPTE